MYVDPSRPLPPVDTKEDYLGSVLNAIINISNKRIERQGTPEEYEEMIAEQQWEADQKLDAFSKWADDTLLAHTSKKGAVHGETKITVGLGNKDNWRMATIQEHIDGQARNVFCHPQGLRELIKARLVIDPKRYIRRRQIPIASGGQLGNVPQWPFSWEEGEVTESLKDPMEYYGQTPWQFSTDNGIFLIPALNGADILTQHTPDPGRPKRAVTPFGGTNIRVYNKTIDIRRTRPSLLRGESNNEPNNELVKGSAHLFDRHAAFYCETDHIGIRAYNKARLPFDVLSNNGITSKNWSGIMESRENMLYNINTSLYNGDLGWGNDIHLIIHVGMWSFIENGLESKNGVGRPAETIANLDKEITSLAVTVPANGKFRIQKSAGQTDSIVVKLSDILNYDPAMRDDLWAMFDQSHVQHVAFTWRNRLLGDMALRIPIGFYSRDTNFYTNYYLDLNLVIKENLATQSATMLVNTLREVDTNIQSLNANFQVMTLGRFVQYGGTVINDPFHPLAFNGTFEAQGGHVKTYTFYNRQYVGYYQHNVGSVKEWIAAGDNIKPNLVKYSYNAISNINNDGMYGDHLRHIPLSANADGTTDYLVHSRDWYHGYRWCVVNVKTDTAPEMLTPTGHHYGPWRNRVEWITPATSTIPSFLISNEEGSSQFDVSGLVFNTQNAFKGFARYAVDVNDVADPVQVLDPVDVDDAILTWIANNGGGWSKSHKQLFYFKNRLFWISQTISSGEVKPDGTDAYFGWIDNCYLDVDGVTGKRTIKVGGTVAANATAKPIKINVKSSLDVLSRDVTGWDSFESADVYTMLMSQSGSRSSYLVMMNVAPFNNFYVEFRAVIDTAAGTTFFEPLVAGAVDPVFPYDADKGFQIDYDKVTGYGSIVPHRLHVNFQTPVMLKKSMWSFRKTPGQYGIFSQSIGFVVASGGIMNTIEGVPIYPVGSVVTVGGSNLIVKSPVSAADAVFGGDEELLIRQHGSSRQDIQTPDGLTLFGVKKNYGLNTEPNSGTAPCGFLRNKKFYHYDPSGWRNALLPVVDGKRMSFYGYGSSFPAFMGIPGSGLPINRFFLKPQATILQWTAEQGRTVYIGPGTNITITINNEVQVYTGGGTFTIPAKFTGTVEIAITGLIRLKWMPGLVVLKQIGNTVTGLDFSGSVQFTILSQLPPSVISLRGAFKDATGAQYPGIENWDTKFITDMTECFSGARNFNGNITTWNTANVTTMESMFEGALAFNQAIGSWAVSRVESMGKMFKGAVGFNQSLAGWNVTRCSVFAEMFMNATKFNGNIANWSVLTCYDFTGMFQGATSFNSDIAKWAITGATRFSRMFKGATSFNFNIAMWDMSAAIYMDEMFSGATSFNRTLAPWVTSKVTTTFEMFLGATAFNSDGSFALDNWDMSNNSNLTRMFSASGYNGPIRNWKFGKDATLYEMFLGCKLFNQDVSSWDVSNVIDMSGMFKQTTAFKTTIDGWKLPNCTEYGSMFAQSNFSGDLTNWDISAKGRINFAAIFSDTPFFNAAGLSTWNVSNVVSMERAFNNAVIFNRDISGWVTSKVETFQDMFNGAKAFNIPVGVWDVKSATTFRNMFKLARVFNQDLNAWNLASAIDLSDIFREATAFNGYIGDWNTSKVTQFHGLFYGATNFNSDITRWDVSKGVDFAAMFGEMQKFDQPIGGWNTVSAVDMRRMFENCLAFNRDLSGWNVNNVTLYEGFSAGDVNWTEPKPNFK